MKKSTTLMIILIYLASIVVIGFFGMKIKVYQPTKYIKSIEMSVEAEDKRMFTFESRGQDENGNHKYDLIIHYDYALTDGEGDKYLPLSLIPYVTYQTGDVNTTEGSIKYVLPDDTKNLVEQGIISLSDKGQFVCYKKTLQIFRIYVKPTEPSGSGTDAEIRVIIE